MPASAEGVRAWPGSSRLAAAADFWRNTLRLADYPESVSEWADLIAGPEPIPGPFDWSLALGAYVAPARRRRSVSRLGMLLDAWHQHGDFRAGEILAHLLYRWLSFADVRDRFDLVTARPPSLYSGPARDAAALLRWPDLTWPSLVDLDLWHRHAAAAFERSPQPLDLQPEDVFTVSRRVAGARVLLVEDRVHSVALTSHWTDLLRGGGAVRAGVLAICAEISDD